MEKIKQWLGLRNWKELFKYAYSPQGEKGVMDYAMDYIKEKNKKLK